MNYLTPELQKRILRSIQDVRSAADVSLFLDEIEAATFQTKADLKGLIKKLLVYCFPLSELMAESAEGVVADICREAKELIKNCDRIKVEMSYIPSRDFSSGLYDIFQSLGYVLFLFDFIVVPGTGTGAHFYHKGNFIDVSMSGLIKEKMKNINFSAQI